jgi:hypothetical protein
MRRADLPADRVIAIPAATRWQAMLHRASLLLAQKSAPEYLSAQCRMHWKAWSHCR